MMENNTTRFQFKCTWKIRGSLSRWSVADMRERFLQRWLWGAKAKSPITVVPSGQNQMGACQDQTEELLSIATKTQSVSSSCLCNTLSACNHCSFGLKNALKRPFPSVQFSPVACRLAGFCASRMVQFHAVTVWIIIQTLVGRKVRKSLKKQNTSTAVKSFILKQSSSVYYSFEYWWNVIQ